MRLGIIGKIRLSFLFIVLLFSFFILYYFPDRQERSLKEGYETEVDNLAKTVAFGTQIALVKKDFAGVQEAMDFVKNDKRLNYVRILRVDSVPASTGNTFTIDTLVFNTYPDTVSEDQSYRSNKHSIIKLAPFYSKVMNGIIVLSFSTEEIKRIKKEIRQTSVIVCAIVLFISLLIGYLLAQNISKPVFALRDAAVQVGLGDYSQRVRKAGKDELGELGIAFNKMVEDLLVTQSQLVQSEKLASLGQLTAGVAHEINNPINFVSGNITPLKRDLDEIMILLEQYATLDQSNYHNKLAEIIQYKDKIDLSYTIAEIKSLMKGIEEGSKRTAEIVKGLRNFSRADDELMIKASVNEGIISTMILLQNKFKNMNIEVEQSLGAIPEINCFPGQLNQVFLNLFTNAIDALNGKGKISVKTYAENNEIKIEIKDNGPGMTENVSKRIFDPFFTTKPVGKGTGLGLSVSYGIIEKHKGKIRVKSEPGVGTEFTITLPVA